MAEDERLMIVEISDEEQLRQMVCFAASILFAVCALIPFAGNLSVRSRKCEP